MVFLRILHAIKKEIANIIFCHNQKIKKEKTKKEKKIEKNPKINISQMGSNSCSFKGNSSLLTRKCSKLHYF